MRRRCRCCSTLSKPTANRPLACSHARPRDSPTQAASNTTCNRARPGCSTTMCAFCSGTLSREYNAPGTMPLLYNTHQAYLRGAEVRRREEMAHTATHTAWGCSLCCVRLQPLLPTGCSLGYLRLQARLREELAHARAHGYTLAVKLVRPTLTPTPALTLARTLALTPTPTPNYPRCAARTPRARRSAATRPCSSRPRPRPTRRTILVRRCCSGGSRRRTALQWRRRCVLQRRRARLWRRRR